MNRINKATFQRHHFDRESGVKYLDVVDFYRNDYKGNAKFGIVYWSMYNNEVNVECRLKGLKELYEIDPVALRDITTTAMDTNIKPLMSEILELPEIPVEWTVGINLISDFYRIFHVTHKDPPIDQILKIFDEKLTPSLEDNPIYLMLVSSGEAGENMMYSELELYTRVRENLKENELKNFKIQYTLYLSELQTTDANTIVRKVLETEFRTIIVDLKSIQPPLTEVKASEIVKITSRHGISLDFSKESEDYVRQVYQKVFRMMYDFSSVETLDKSLQTEIEKFGNDFYFADRFRVWYPVTLKKEEGEWCITERESKRNLGEKLSEFNNYLIEKGLDKLSNTKYRVDLEYWLRSSWEYGLINSIYVGPSDCNDPIPKVLTERRNWIGG